MFLSCCVGEDLVGAAQNERDAETSVLDAQDEAAAVASFSHLVGPISLLTFSSTRPIPCASYKCTSARWSFPSGRQTVARPLSFLHRPGPKILLSLSSSRI